MDDQHTEYPFTQRNAAAHINEALTAENDRLKARIRTLEEKISSLEEAAVHILKNCTRGADRAR
jgi:cell division protein FtsB|tara:strand:- start:3414 stop:3605 length:192 start_codon:yes stop_codon:yes gene_type:complete